MTAIITVDNFSDTLYQGWHRTTTDTYEGRPERGVFPVEGGGLVRYVLGDLVAEGARAIDLFVTVEPGQSIRIIQDPVDDATPVPADGTIDFGGEPVAVVTRGGVEYETPMVLMTTPHINGRAFEATWLAHIGDGFWVHLETRYYPGQPWVEAELSVTQSSRMPALRVFLEGLRIKWGTSFPWIVGGPGTLTHGRVIQNTWFTDAQMRILPMVFGWDGFWPAAVPKMDGTIAAWGIQRLLPDGQPRQGTSEAVVAWGRQHIRELREDLHNWDRIALGVSERGPDTGDQEDQVFVGAEGSVWAPAVTLRYLTALKFGNRPCHHLDDDGSVLRGDRYPGLRFWGMRPDPRFSNSLLGKPRQLQDREAEGGWTNAYASHWLVNTLAAVNRSTGSPTVQRLLAHQAENYLLERPSNPRETSSVIWQPREILWECIGVLHLLREIVDPALRQRVQGRFVERWSSVILPYLQKASTERNGIWRIVVDDTRIGLGEWWEPWMQGAGAYGLDTLGRYLASKGFAIGEEMVARARVSAAKVVTEAYPEGRFIPYDTLALDGRVVDKGTFADAWTPLAAAVLLRHDSSSHQARTICQAWADRLSGKADQSWLPPGIVDILRSGS